MTVVLVGTNQIQYPATDPTSIALPSGTRRGDLIVVSAISNVSISMSDPRMTERASQGDGVTIGKIWTGVEDGSGADVGLSMVDATGFPYSVAVLAVFRSKILGAVNTIVNAVNPALPSVPYNAAVGVSFSGYDTVDGRTETPVADGWVAAVSPSTAKVHASVIYWEGSPAGSPTSVWGHAGNQVAGRSGYAVFGISPLALVAPPCRLIRDDDLGVGGARIYPPPKSQQRSSRGVGYY